MSSIVCFSGKFSPRIILVISSHRRFFASWSLIYSLEGISQIALRFPELMLPCQKSFCKREIYVWLTREVRGDWRQPYSLPFRITTLFGCGQPNGCHNDISSLVVAAARILDFLMRGLTWAVIGLNSYRSLAATDRLLLISANFLQLNPLPFVRSLLYLINGHRHLVLRSNHSLHFWIVVYSVLCNFLLLFTSAEVFSTFVPTNALSTYMLTYSNFFAGWIQSVSNFDICHNQDQTLYLAKTYQRQLYLLSIFLCR